MPDAETKLKREPPPKAPVEIAAAAPPPSAPVQARRLRLVPLLVTLASIAVAVALGRAMWTTYMGAPWTRDGTVRTYVVTMAPEVGGRIVQLHIADNQFVRK